ncbi:outer membrane lipoprotein carrier protein LolA [Streptomyces ovatisporus]|uniref:Outer membrane lipoprotein carrier protein LolA n=1 Tax=Streptomyces ovatisporus TaxID=1128682 RepID=A0ABV9AD86_9ACTN
MAQIQPRTPGRKAVRYGIPVAVAGIAAATVGLVPALASSGNPDLPKISAQKLVEKMAASDTQHMSGTVKVSTDLGLPALPGMDGGGKQGGGLFGGGPHGDGPGGEEKGRGGGKDSTAEPQEKLMELASGEHTLRVAADGPDKQRVSIVEEAAEYSWIHNGNEVWAYDSGSDTAFHAVAPEDAVSKHREHSEKLEKGLQNVTPQEAARQVLKASKDTTSVSVDGTAQIAGRDAYQLLVKPKGAPHSTVDSVRIAVDAENGTPLKFTLIPEGGGKPAVEVVYTKVDFGKPSAGTFDFEPPKGTDVTEEKLDGKALREHSGKPEKGAKGEKGLRPDASGLNTIGKGWGAVAELKSPEGAVSGLPGMGGGDAKGGARDGSKSPQAQEMLDSFTEKAEGDFGTGRVFSTRLVNALMTEDGTVYVGAVSKEGLIKAAEAAGK